MIACDKNGYESRRQALQAAVGMAKKVLHSKKMPKKAYRCTGCGQWHLTTHLPKLKALRRVKTDIVTKDVKSIKHNKTNQILRIQNFSSARI